MTENTNKIPQTFDEAMLEFQKLKVQATKSSKNPHFKNQYASLEDVMRACDEGNQFGLVYSQPLDLIEIGGQVLQVVMTTVTHVPSNETRKSPCPIRMKDPNNPQSMGSGITYSKRYALQAFYGLCSDDDGNFAAQEPLFDTSKAPVHDVATKVAPRGKWAEKAKEFLEHFKAIDLDADYEQYKDIAEEKLKDKNFLGLVEFVNLNKLRDTEPYKECLDEANRVKQSKSRNKSVAETRAYLDAKGL